MAFSSTTALALAKISELAYLPKDELPEKIKDLKIRNSRILSDEKNIVFLSRENNKSDTECYLFLTGRKDIVVAFRGSEDFDEEGEFKGWIKTDLDIASFEYPLDDGDPGFFGKNEQFVHHGFWEAYKTIRTKLLKETLSFYNSGYGRKRNLYITGHSPGGALAIHTARELYQIFDLPVKAYTFGSPRVGNDDFAKVFNAQYIRSLSFRTKT